jgi:hypothetical protein
MSDDFCLIHGYEHMKTQFGNPIAYCEACENERDLISSAEKQAAACHCGKDGHTLNSVNCPVHAPSHHSELRKLQEIIDAQADQILDLHEVLKSAYLLNEFIAGAYVLSLADFRYLNVVSTKIKAALPGGDVTPVEPQGARK